MNQLLRNRYYDLGLPGAFRGKFGFKKSLKESGIKITEKQIIQFLSSQPPYTKFKHLISKFPKRKVLSFFPGHMLQADLLEIGKILQPHNNPVKFILIIIDCFSRYIWSYPLPNKYAKTIKSAFDLFLESHNVIPNVLYVDKGGEWEDLKKTAKNYGFQLWFSESDQKASIVERAIGTLRRVVSRYLDHENTHHFVTIFPQIVNSYNNTYHSVIKTSPAKANTAPNRKIFENIYKRKSFSNAVIPREKLGLPPKTLVRISRLRPHFQKKTMNETATGQVYRITKSLIRGGFRVYQLANLKNKIIPGTFYKQDLVPVTQNRNDLHKLIIMKRRVRKGIPEVLVRWKDYESDFDEWIPEANLEDLTKP